MERIETTDHKVSCDGGSKNLGHPKIYLEFGPNRKELECPYCGRVFVLKKAS